MVRTQSAPVTGSVAEPNPALRVAAEAVRYPSDFKSHLYPGDGVGETFTCKRVVASVLEISNGGSKTGSTVAAIPLGHESNKSYRGAMKVDLFLVDRFGVRKKVHALIDTGADLSCIRRDVVPANCIIRKVRESLHNAKGARMSGGNTALVGVDYDDSTGARIDLGAPDLAIVDSLSYEVILGIDFLRSAETN